MTGTLSSKNGLVEAHCILRGNALGLGRRSATTLHRRNAGSSRKRQSLRARSLRSVTVPKVGTDAESIVCLMNSLDVLIEEGVIADDPLL